MCCHDDWLTRILRRWGDMERWTKVFCVVALLNYVCLFTLAAFPFLADVIHKNGGGVIQGIYPFSKTAAFLVILGFQIAHTYIGLVKDNIYELYATFATQIFITANIVFQTIYQNDNSIYQYCLVAYAILFQALYFGLAYPLHKEYDWAFYRKAGADAVFRSKYRKLLRFTATFKVDFMISVVNALCISPLIAYPLTVLFGAALLCVVVAIVYFLVGHYAIREEITWLIGAFWVSSLIGPVLVSFGIYRIFDVVEEFQRHPSNADDRVTLAVLFFVTGVFSLALRLAVVILSVFVYRHFGQGLRNLEFLKQHQESDDDLYESGSDSGAHRTIGDVVRSTYSYQRDAYQ